MIARRDAPWQATDVVSPGDATPGRRFIAAEQANGRWRIWYETGGIAHLYNLTVLEHDGASWRVARTLSEGGLGGLCRGIDAAPGPHGPGG